MIPVIRVNYTIPQILRAFFIGNVGSKYQAILQNQIIRMFGCTEVVLTSSCRNAICILLKSLPQKKVIVPAYTCGVVVEAALIAEKEVVYVKVNPNTLNVDEYLEIDADSIVIATHQYGLPCNMKELIARCKQIGAPVIEDCAGSLGTTIENRLTGTFGDYGVFSFSASKTLHAPTKGGFIIANGNNTLSRISEMPNKCSLNFKVKHLLKGVGFCLNNNNIFCSLMQMIAKVGKGNAQEDAASFRREETYKHGFYEWQAYLMTKQFENIEKILSARKEMVRLYNQGITNPLVAKLVYNPESVNIRYPVFVEHRDSFISKAREGGIQMGSGYEKIYCPKDLEIENKIIKSIVYLPMGNDYSQKEINKVINFVNNYKA